MNYVRHIFDYVPCNFKKVLPRFSGVRILIHQEPEPFRQQADKPDLRRCGCANGRRALLGHKRLHLHVAAVGAYHYLELARVVLVHKVGIVILQLVGAYGKRNVAALAFL